MNRMMSCAAILALAASTTAAADTPMNDADSQQQVTEQAATPSSDQVVSLGVDSELSLARQFELLDQNGDGLFSRDEARVDTRLLAIYDSIDTDETISNVGGETPDGATLAQYKAAMNALANGGVVGEPVAGGGTYTLREDGTLVPSDSGESAAGE